VAEHHRPVDPERIAEGAYVVGADLEAPVLRVVARRPAVVAQVDIDHLSRGGQRADVGLEIGVVEAARSPVYDDDRGALPHPRPVGHERRSVDIEPQPGTVDVDMHADSPRLVQPTSLRPGGGALSRVAATII
jgi:hypothetical protein